MSVSELLVIELILFLISSAFSISINLFFFIKSSNEGIKCLSHLYSKYFPVPFSSLLLTFFMKKLTTIIINAMRKCVSNINNTHITCSLSPFQSFKEEVTGEKGWRFKEINYYSSFHYLNLLFYVDAQRVENEDENYF